MYKDTDVWPIKCASCDHEFTEQIGRIEAGSEIGCPECGTANDPCEQCPVYLSKARNGEFDPWGAHGPHQEAAAPILSPIVGAAVGAGIGSLIGNSIYQHQKHGESDAPAEDAGWQSIAVDDTYPERPIAASPGAAIWSVSTPVRPSRRATLDGIDRVARPSSF